MFVDDVKVEPNKEKQIFLTSGGGGDDLWELNEGDILQPRDGKTFTLKKPTRLTQKQEIQINI